MSDEDQPPQFAEIRNPESYSDEEIDRLGAAFVSAIEFAGPIDYERLLHASLEAARKSKSATSKQDFIQAQAALQTSLRDAKSTEAGLSAWCDRLGDRTSAKMKLLLEGFAHLVADIHAALGGELPGQDPPIDLNGNNDEGEEWKRKQ